jgi:hypothetical protein
MKNRGMEIKHPKLRGEWVELRFMLRAIELGLHLNKPWGEVVPYDFVVEHEGRFARVQVKSTMFADRGGYSCTVRGSDGPYEGDPFDYLAAYIFQEDLWYIIPAELVVGQGSIALYPEYGRAKYGPYMEAWDLLRADAGVDLEACAEEQGGSWRRWFSLRDILAALSRLSSPLVPNPPYRDGSGNFVT